MRTVGRAVRRDRCDAPRRVDWLEQQPYPPMTLISRMRCGARERLGNTEARCSITASAQRDLTLHLLIRWALSQGPLTVELHRQVAERAGSVWWGKIGDPEGRAAIGDRRSEQLQAQLDAGIETHVYLYRTGSELWRTVLVEFSSELPTEEAALIPEYYRAEATSGGGDVGDAGEVTDLESSEGVVEKSGRRAADVQPTEEHRQALRDYLNDPESVSWNLMHEVWLAGLVDRGHRDGKRVFVPVSDGTTGGSGSYHLWLKLGDFQELPATDLERELTLADSTSDLDTALRGQAALMYVNERSPGPQPASVALLVGKPRVKLRHGARRRIRLGSRRRQGRSAQASLGEHAGCSGRRPRHSLRERQDPGGQ